jgi:hypothetical protein
MFFLENVVTGKVDCGCGDDHGVPSMAGFVVGWGGVILTNRSPSRIGAITVLLK